VTNTGLVVCVAEIVRAFTYVINQGWVLYWATSRWSPVEIMASIQQFFSKFKLTSDTVNCLTVIPFTTNVLLCSYVC